MAATPSIAPGQTKPIPSDSPSAASQPSTNLALQCLADPRSYPDHPRTVQRIDTHASSVFLTDRTVYKLKKPVRFDFLDFSTVEKREQACREELRLNRRMAPSVYTAVVPITLQPDGSAAIGGSGRPLDWVVQMRRLPAERMLDELIRSHRLTDADIRRLADFLGKYYAAAEPLVLRTDEFLASLIEHVEENFRTLCAAPGVELAQVRRVHTPQLRLLKCNLDLFRSRVLDGRVIDGHGDLRPEHVCLLDPPVVFDCLEFSASLRHVDVLDELCFLAMECDALQAESVGQSMLDAYRKASHDRPPQALVTFYKAYRACVRAKVAALRATQLTGEATDAQLRLVAQYLDLAEGYLQAAGVRPLLLVVSGLMGSGKSTLARAFSDELGIEILRTDAVRDELFPEKDAADDFAQGRYRPEARRQVYDEVFRRATMQLAAGNSVVLDGTFAEATSQDAALQCAEAAGADVRFVQCTCPRDVALQRIESRRRQNPADPSEARPELYDRQAAARQQSEGCGPPCCVDTTESMGAQLRAVFADLPHPFVESVN